MWIRDAISQSRARAARGFTAEASLHLPLSGDRVVCSSLSVPSCGRLRPSITRRYLLFVHLDRPKPRIGYADPPSISFCLHLACIRRRRRPEVGAVAQVRPIFIYGVIFPRWSLTSSPSPWARTHRIACTHTRQENCPPPPAHSRAICLRSFRRTSNEHHTQYGEEMYTHFFTPPELWRFSQILSARCLRRPDFGIGPRQAQP